MNKLPSSASIAHVNEGDKLTAPAATRNADAICDMICRVAPKHGQALELASGTGEHVIRFAAAMPNVIWHPSDIDPTRLKSIKAYAQDAGLDNLQDPLSVDACTPGWAEQHDPKDLILKANFLHLISDRAMQVLISESAQMLRSQGVLMIYGPFKRDGALTSEGDRVFDAQLRAADPMIGYKDHSTVAECAKGNGLIPDQPIEMPSNNLALVFRKPQ